MRAAVRKARQTTNLFINTTVWRRAVPASLQQLLLWLLLLLRVMRMRMMMMEICRCLDACRKTYVHC